jgi:hypothetical protein
MPIFIFTKSGREPVVARGERLGVFVRILLMLGFPVTLQALDADDWFTVPARSIDRIHTFTDEILRTRQAAHAAQQEQAELRNRGPKPGDKPRLVIPGKG